MARYEVTGPDGQKYEITAPDAASESEILTYFQSQVQATSKTAPAQPDAPHMGTLEDVARSGGAGLVRGATGLVGLPGTLEQIGRAGVNWLGGAGTVPNETALPTGADVQSKLESYTGKFHQPKTTAGEYARTIGEFAPGALFPGGLAQKVLGNVVGPAVASETAGQMTKGTSLEPWARLGGALAGGHLANVPQRAYTPVQTSQAQRRAVDTLRREGVDALSAGEVTGSKPLRWMEQHASDIPFSGGRGHQMSERAAEQFTRAALRRAGIQADRAEPQVMAAGFQRIGGEIDTLARQSSARLTPADVQQMTRHITDYQAVTPPSLAAPVVRELMDDVVAAGTRNTPMSGQQYARYRSLIEGVARGADDPGQQRALRDVLGVLDRAVDRGLPRPLRGEWRRVRNEYRNMLVLEKAATGAGENAARGIISPAQLRQATKTTHGLRNFATGRGDFDDLARAGVAVMSPLPNSGTPARIAAGNLGNAVGLGTGALFGGAPGAAIGAIAAPVAQGLIARGFMSGPMQRYMGANARMQPLAIQGGEGGIRSLPFAFGGLGQEN
jgi:hypothetical protein